MRRLFAGVLFAGAGCLLLGVKGGPTPVPRGSIGRTYLLARAQAGEAKRERSAEGRPFRLPADEGGALLARVLPPRQPHGPLPDPVGAARRTPPADFALPPLPLPRTDDLLPRLQTPPSGRVLRPQLVLEERLAEAQTPAVPQRLSFAVGLRLREDAPDANLPLPLPILARPVPERASLEDATLEASTAAALAGPLPRRTTPAPARQISVPDPYENRRPLLQPAPAESAAPVARGPRPPG
jgi:hypothetical protein